MSRFPIPAQDKQWKPRVREALREISPEIAKGLLESSKGSAMLAGIRTLRALSEADRMAVWKAAFPAMAAEVELAWHHLDPQVLVRRDGGESGYGARFTFRPTPDEADVAMIVWLRKLLMFTARYPEAAVDSLLANHLHLDLPNFDSDCGHMSDSDAPAYLASLVLGKLPESGLSIRLADLCEDHLLGRHSGACDRAIFTAAFCADRPDLWKRIHGHLPSAGNEPGFLERIGTVPIGCLPGAALSYLHTIRDHDLLRFGVISERVRSFFGIAWQWKSQQRDDLRPWLVDWVSKIEKAPQDIRELPDDAASCFLTLWAQAFHDGDSALARIADPTVLGTDSRIAAAHFLGLCPAEKRLSVIYRYVVDSDLRVVNIACGMLSAYGNRLPEASERPALYRSFCDLKLGLPAKPALPPCPAPLPSPPLDLSGIDLALANLFPDGSERDIERLLPGLAAEARRAVVRRLNRYSLTDFDREMEKIFIGKDPEEWRRWQEDHAGSESMAQRRMLLLMVGDRNAEVAEAAGKAVAGFHLTESELPLVRPVLKGKGVAKRLIVTRLLARQSEPMLRALLPQLLAAKSADERLAALEILRQLAESEATAALASTILQSAAYLPASAEETRAFGVLEKSIRPASETPSFENAFGLIDPTTLAPPVEPREHEVIIHSPVTLRLIESLDAWIQRHAEVMVRSNSYNTDEARLADGKLESPYVNATNSREDLLARFPLTAELADWWNLRAANHRDPDGFEGLRLEFAIERLLDSKDPKQHLMRTQLFGCEHAPITKSSRYLMSQVFRWLHFILPGVIPTEGRIDYLIDSTETLTVRLPEPQRNWSIVWGERLGKYLNTKGEFAPRASLERLWSLIRKPAVGERVMLGTYLWQIAFLLREGIASEDELIWFLIGPRPFDKYSQERAFGDLAMATSPPGSYGSHLHFPAAQRAVRKITDRIIELELTRGEEPEIWSHAAVKVASVHGAGNLRRLLVALGKAPLRRPASRSSSPNLTRLAVLIHLIHSSRPDEEDTPESFTAQMQEAGIPATRLLEIALMRPAWTPFIAHATGIARLRDAVGWIYAHTRSTDYIWEAKAKEIWAGELGFDSALTAEELIEGAVDADWFFRAHSAVGAEVWETLDGAAKFASTSNGHTRARLFADALLGNAGVDELETRLSTRGELNAALAIGLPPMRSEGQARQSELLRRYGILQRLRVTARKSKAQRRASEIAAFETGVRNLARRAGYDDTVRFEWAMECAAVADLTESSLQADLGDVNCAIVIQPDGTLAMQASRDGKPLAAVPAAAKKHAAFKTLKERMDELKAQASRLRPSLESLMVRAVVLPVSEWKGILAHPLAGPLLQHLLLADADGPLGFPSAAGLLGADGIIHGWPPESTGLHLAHPTGLLPAETWHEWQRFVFAQRIVQPFKQIFREAYLPAGEETTGPHARSSRFAGHELLSNKALSILSQRGWIQYPDEGLYRAFRNDDLCAWLAIIPDRETNRISLHDLRFTRFGRHAAPVAPEAVPLRVFSETLRDIDLIVSVAHADGAVPEAGQSTVEIRADLIRETCRMLEIHHVEVEGRHARIAGKLGNYRVHLGSGVAHREPGTMIPLRSDPQTERGRIFLPFAEDDPQGIDILSRVLLLANDVNVRDPALAQALRQLGR